MNEIIEDVEIIVSDNCSTDGTIPYLENMMLTEERLIINNNKENIGGDNNIRKLLGLAKGEYVLFLGDDYIVKNGINIICKTLHDVRPDILHLSYGTYTDFTDLGKIIKSNRYATSKKVILDSLMVVNKSDVSKIISVELSHFMFMSSNVYKKSILIDKEYQPEYGTTLLYSLAALSYGKLYYSSDVIIYSCPNTSWSDKRLYVWFDVIPKILMYSKTFGYSSKEIKRMMDGHIAQVCVYCIKWLHIMLKYVLKHNYLRYFNPSVLFLFVYKFNKLCITKLAANISKMRG